MTKDDILHAVQGTLPGTMDTMLCLCLLCLCLHSATGQGQLLSRLGNWELCPHLVVDLDTLELTSAFLETYRAVAAARAVRLHHGEARAVQEAEGQVAEAVVPARGEAGAGPPLRVDRHPLRLH